MLEQKLKENKAKLAEQDKTLFCLRFRHILERLPPPAREGKKEKNAWDDFWKGALNQANEGRASPLSGIVRHYGKDEKKRDGAGTVHKVDYPRINGAAPLYSTLSVDIHHYAVGPEDVAPVSWHRLERDVFNALKPQKENIHPDGTMNWELESARFVASNESETKDSSKSEEL